MNRLMNIAIWMIVFTISVVTINAQAQTTTIIFVDSTAPTSGDGTSWATAFPDLQSGLDAAGILPPPVEIWVAAGVYVPSARTDRTDPRTATLQLMNGVALYGGFAGKETTRKERDWLLNETILSGDLLGNDGPDFLNNEDNTYHVVTANKIDESATLDGFTITSGNASFPTNQNSPFNDGGGMWAGCANPTIANCTFRGNSAAKDGGGLFLHGQIFTSCAGWDNLLVFNLSHCIFTANTAERGGGAYIEKMTGTTSHCLFEGNRATGTSGFFSGGGGLFVHWGERNIEDCTFQNNEATRAGGGMRIHSSVISVARCLFSGNHALSGGGGYVFGIGVAEYIQSEFINNTAASGAGLTSTRSSLSQCLFSGNTATGSGGALISNDFAIEQCSFEDNIASFGGAIWTFDYSSNDSNSITGTQFQRNITLADGGAVFQENSHLAIQNCEFRNGQAASGGAIHLVAATLDIAESQFIQNTAPFGGAVYHEAGTVSMDHCSFEGNQGVEGGALSATQSTGQYDFCTFLNNSAQLGGGFHHLNASNAQFVDCVFQNNFATWHGGGFYAFQSAQSFSRCVLQGNLTIGNGGGLFTQEGNVSLSQCIIRDNQAEYGGGIYCAFAKSFLAEECMFAGNSSSKLGGGALVGEIGIGQFIDCRFIGNSSSWGGAGEYIAVGEFIHERCLYRGNQAIQNGATKPSGGGVYARKVTASFLECNFEENEATRGGGGLYALTTNNSTGGQDERFDLFFEGCNFINNVSEDTGNSGFGGGLEAWVNTAAESNILTMKHCIFQGNEANTGGGMVLVALNSPTLGEQSLITTLQNCQFISNHAVDGAGAMWLAGIGSSYSTTSAVNCIYSGNTAPWVAAIADSFGLFNATNCTIVNNFASDEWGGVFADSDTATLTNCILWNNQDATGNGVLAQFNRPESPILTFSCIQNYTGTGTGNIADDPLFIDLDGPDNLPGTADDNLRLSSASPCIDAGSNAALPPDTLDLDGDGDLLEPLPLDIAGQTRIINGIVDMGAYEFVNALCSADCAPPGGNGTVNIDDLVAILNAWGTLGGACDIAPEDPAGGPTGDGTVNLLDLQAVLNAWGSCP